MKIKEKLSQEILKAKNFIHKKGYKLIYTEEKQISDINTKITTLSPYPIPWKDSLGDRPKDYYEKQSKVICYYKFGKKIEIKIPAVKQGENRERMISVFIDDKLFEFEHSNILNMKATFKFANANLLIKNVSDTSNSENNSHLQAIAPFVYLSNVSQYMYFEQKEVNETNIDIITLSPYPIPWENSLGDRPEDYYEKQSKVIYYYKFDKKIEIKIPSVLPGESRVQVITVLIDDKLFKLKNGKLNSKKYGDITEVISSVLSDWDREEDMTELCSSIIKDWDGMEDKDYQFNKKKQGDIIRTLSPFIEEMAKLNGLSLVRELLIPVVTKGIPHHWNLCLLSIDEHDVPSLLYIESAAILKKDVGSYLIYLEYMKDYKEVILPHINKLLTEFNYQEIKDVQYCQAKQFSIEGCGIAMSLNMRKIIEGNYPQIICSSSSKYKKIPWDQVNKLSTNITIEEDALTRVELAFKTQRQKEIIFQNFDKNLLVKNRKELENLIEIKNLNCREIQCHPHTLKTNAQEAFTFFKPLVVSEELKVDSSQCIISSIR